MKALLIVLLSVLYILFLNQCNRFDTEEPFDNTPVDIPDRAFLYDLISLGIDTNNDSIICYGEAEAVTSLNATNYYGYYITDIKGIEAFTNLTSLICRCNVIEGLDLSKNTKLQEVFAYDNALEYIDVSKCLELKELHVGSEGYCDKNRLSRLDVSNNSHLRTLKCGNNQLSELDLSHNSELEVLECHLNQITELDLSNNNRLLNLVVWSNLLTKLDVSNCRSLKELDIRSTQITTLELSNNTSLLDLDVCRNFISSICISHNTKLERIFLSDMPILENVCVWILPFPPEGVNLDITGSPSISFTTGFQNH
jgi:Leucine-rich repeat (LRR) protein